jgi:hypothetical protein
VGTVNVFKLFEEMKGREGKRKGGEGKKTEGTK